MTDSISDVSQIINWLSILGGDGTSVFTLIRDISAVMGFVVLFIAMIRLTKHGKAQKMFRYYAPVTTFLMFFSGIMLISMSGYIQMVSSTLFPDARLKSINQISSYINDIQGDGSNVDLAQQYLVFGLLNIVGFISIIRGMVLLMNVSEGQNHTGSIAQVISHLLAGIVGINAEFFLHLCSRLYSVKDLF